ncbi:IgGFc-binding protein [Labilithrix luteola]|nr:IgGFc-binding protein [Labilithrix luteola]
MSSFVRCTAVGSMFLFVGFVACKSDDRAFEQDSTPRVADDDGSVSIPAEACAGRKCSRDLHEVLDGCTDEVVERCADGFGCGNGKCTTPCDAAVGSQGSLGCSFWTTPPDAHQASDVSCFAAFIANTWTTPATIKATFGRDAIDVSKSIYRASSTADGVHYEHFDGPVPPGEVAVVFLSQGTPGPNSAAFVPCPSGVEVAYHGTVVSAHDTSIYKAFHLETDVPVSAYSSFPYGGAQSYIPSATLLLPTSSWGTNYVLVDGYPGDEDPRFVQIVAQEDDTVVRIHPRADVKPGVNVEGAAKGVTHSWTLQKGQILEFRQLESLAGSPLESNHPVALFGGTQCPYIPSTIEACDTLHQQIPPVNQWGSSYSGIPYKSRRGNLAERVYWRIGAAREGTTLTWEPSVPDGAPVTLGSGEFVDFATDKTFHVHSQDSTYPIYLADFMSGANMYASDGDPDFVNVVPDEQFLDNYVFFVDYTYATSTLTIVRKKDSKGFHDVNLDCVGKVSGWQPLGTSGDIEYTWLDVTRAGKSVPTDIGVCSYGRHEASSDGPFALYVWGTDYAASYGYPAGAGSRPTSPFKIEVQ